MTAKKTWNTWDIRCLNAVMKLPDMAEIRVALYDDFEKYFQDEFLWTNVTRFGIHHPYGKYFDIDLKFQDVIFNMEFAGEGDMFVYRITPQKNLSHIKFYIECMLRWNAEGAIEKKNGSLHMKTDCGDYLITICGDVDTKTPVNASYPGILVKSNKAIYIKCNNNLTEKEIDDFINTKKDECFNELTAGGGILEDTPQAIVKGVMWNTIYEPIGDRLCTPVSREWCIDNGKYFGSYVLFDWDTFFCGILSSIQDKDIAYEQIKSILQEFTDDGMIPNFSSQRGKSFDRSQPPVGSYCVLKLFRQFGDKELLEESFVKLLLWNRWWMKNRDGNNDGLLEWGSNLFPEGVKNLYGYNTLQSARFESGLDNSPMYDDAVFNKDTHTMELADVGLNAFYALDTISLSQIAKELGRENIAEELEKEYARIKDLMNKELWDENTGIYLNKYWNGKFSYRISPTNFYPLIAGVASKEQAHRMIEEHLKNPNEFWDEYMIASTPKNDPAFHDNDYWRGRIWGPMNFLVAEGIKRYGLRDTAYDFAKKNLNLFLNEWREENHIHENYNPKTGDGDDVKNADPVYTWGGLTGYVAIQELIDAEPWDGIRFGNLSGDKAYITNYPIGKDRYTVDIQDGITVLKNSKPFIKSSVPIIISGLRYTGSAISMKLECKQSGTLLIEQLSNIDCVNIYINGTQYEFKTDDSKVCISF